MIKPKTLSGFQDLLPEVAYQKTVIIDQIKTVFNSFGFSPIETPHLEYSEMLLGETGGEIGKQLFRFQDNGDRDVCLRFDLTIPLARYFVQHQNDLGLPFKRYAIGSCFRGERPQKGRYREFTQCDFDILGVDSVSADLEICQVIAGGFQALGVKNFTIKINSRNILTGFLESIDLANVAVDVIRIFDKRDKISADKFNEELEKIGCSELQINSIAEFFNLSESASDNISLLKELKTFSASHQSFSDAVAQFTERIVLASEVQNLAPHLKVDLGLARGFGYYTGIVFETVLDDAPEVGSVAGGGRYNDLTKNFSKSDIPGVGASFGVSRIMAALEKLDLDLKTQGLDLLISNLEPDLLLEVTKIAAEMRSSGISVELFPDTVKLKKQLQYADRKKIPYMLIYGASEHQDQVFKLKNLQDGEQSECKTLAEIAKLITAD